MLPSPVRPIDLPQHLLRLLVRVLMRLPEVLCLLFHLQSDLVTTCSILLVLHRLDHGRKALDAFDQSILVFPL